MEEHYIVEFKILNKSYYCIWFTNDIDGFLTGDFNLLSFREISGVCEYCNQHNIICNKETTLYDIDKLRDWVYGNNKIVDCALLLNMWNIIDDVSHSVNIKFLGDENKTLNIYDKLFHGNNIASYMKTESVYIPDWRKDETELLTQIMADGINLIMNALNVK